MGLLVGDGCIRRLPLRALLHSAQGGAFAVLWLFCHGAPVHQRRVMPVHLCITAASECTYVCMYSAIPAWQPGTHGVSLTLIQRLLATRGWTRDLPSVSVHMPHSLVHQ